MMTSTDLIDWASQIVSTAAYCLPKAAMDAIDTFKLWAMIVAGCAAVVSLIMVGIGMWMQHRRQDGGQVMGQLAIWIFGAILVTAASAIAGIFVRYPTDCIPL
jgi:hypothetical protein